MLTEYCIIVAIYSVVVVLVDVMIFVFVVVVVRVVVVYFRYGFHVHSGVTIEPRSIKKKTATLMIVLGIVQITHHTLPSELDGTEINTISERIMSNPQPRMRIRIEK